MLTKNKAIRRPIMSCFFEFWPWDATCSGPDPFDNDPESVVPVAGFAMAASLPVRSHVLTSSACRTLTHFYCRSALGDPHRFAESWVGNNGRALVPGAPTIRR